MLWPGQRATFERLVNGTPDAGSGPDAGPPLPPPAATDSGCGCNLPPASARYGLAAIALGVAVSVLRKLRARR